MSPTFTVSAATRVLFRSSVFWPRGDHIALSRVFRSDDRHVIISLTECDQHLRKRQSLVYWLTLTTYFAQVVRSQFLPPPEDSQKHGALLQFQPVFLFHIDPFHW